MAHFLDALFNPRAVAMVGASTDPTKIGGLPLSFCKQYGYRGRLLPVHPKADIVQGLPAAPSVAAIEGDVDCAVIMVPAPAVVSAIEDCGAKGVPVATVFSSGFAEMGADGAKAQQRVEDAAKAAGVRMLGPNCMGAFSVQSGLVATFTSSFQHHDDDGFPRPGRISVVSQSGAIGVHILVMLRDRGLGMSKWVTTGNQADVDVADCIAYLAEDPETDTMVVYVEGCDDGPKLRRALEAAHKAGKPVIALKVGTTEAGARAAQSHTASLAGSDRIYDAVFRETGTWRARTMSELTDIAAAFGGERRPANANVALVTISGGVGILMADSCTEFGLKMPPLRKSGQEALLNRIPYASVTNPIDTSAPGMFDMEANVAFIEEAASDPKYGTVIAFLTHLPMTPRYGDLRERLLAMRKRVPNPVIALVMRTNDAQRRDLEDAGFAIYDDPTRAVEATAALVRAT